MRIAGVDPGAHNGVAIYDTELKKFVFADQKMLTKTKTGYQLSGSEMEDWLFDIADGAYDLDVFVCENFIQRPRKMAGKGNEVWIEQYTAEVVGACALVARIGDASFVKQEPLILEAAYAWLGWNYKTDKNHIKDGMAHAYHWGRKHGVIERKTLDVQPTNQ